MPPRPPNQILWELLCSCILLYAAITSSAHWLTVPFGVLSGIGFGMSLVEYNVFLKKKIAELEAQLATGVEDGQ